MSRDLCARVIGGNVEPRGHAGQLIPSVRGAGQGYVSDPSPLICDRS